MNEKICWKYTVNSFLFIKFQLCSMFWPLIVSEYYLHSPWYISALLTWTVHRMWLENNKPPFFVSVAIKRDNIDKHEIRDSLRNTLAACWGGSGELSITIVKLRKMKIELGGKLSVWCFMIKSSIECWQVSWSSYLYRAEHINNVVMLGTV